MIDTNTKSMDITTNNKDVFSNETNPSASNRVATFGTKIWPGGVVPYFIEPSHFNGQEINNIFQAINYIQQVWFLKLCFESISRAFKDAASVNKSTVLMYTVLLEHLPQIWEDLEQE